MQRLIALLAALVLVLVVPAAAIAAPPTNDLPAGATALPASLPQSFTQDTTEATVSEPEDVGCGSGGLDLATVWYTFTPAADVRLLIDASTTDYQVGINVFAGTPSFESLVNCFEQAGAFDLAGGTTYYVMFADINDDNVNGGTLSATLSVAPPPVEVTVTVDRTAKVSHDFSSALLSGTVTCSADAEVFLDLFLQQRVGRYVVRGFGGVEAACGTEPVDWSSDVFPENGKFAGGRATLELFAIACDPLQCSESQHTFTVRLRR